MDIDFFKIIRKAYEIALHKRYLWIFGVFAGGFGGFQIYNFSLPTGETDTFLNNLNFDTFWANNGMLVIFAGLVMFLIGIIWWIVSIISTGGLIGSVRAIEQDRHFNFRMGLSYGAKCFWRVLGAGLLYGLIVLLSILVLVFPVILFIISKVYVLAIIYGIIVFLLCLALWIYMGIVFPYTIRIATIQDKGALEALRDTWPFFQKHWKDIIILYLIMMAIFIGIGMGYIFAILIVGGLLFAIGYGIYLASVVLAIIYAFIAILGLLLLFMIIGGILNTFNSSVYTLVFLELKKK